MKQPAAGTAMRCHMVRTRFVADGTPGPKLDAKLADRISEVRRLLRTDLSIGQIAAQLGVCAPSLRRFVRRRGLCNIADRAQFIRRQKTLSRSA
jgi:hypothetical protein